MTNTFGRRFRPLPRAIAVLVALAVVACVGLARAQDAAASGEPAEAVRAAEIHTAPAADAPATGESLAPGEAVTVTGRSGRWAAVRRADGRRGWVVAAHLRIGAAGGTSTGAGADWLRSITGLLSPRGTAAPSSGTVSVGVRGLDREDLEAARPDPRAVAGLDAYRASGDAARRHARSQRLTSRDVAYVAPGNASP